MPGDQSDLLQETVHSKKNGTLRLVSLVGSVGPTLLSLVKEYKESAFKEKKTRKKGTEWQSDQSDLLQETVHSKKNGTLRLVSLVGSVGPTLLSLVKEYKESAFKEKKTRKKGTEWQNNLYWQFLEKLQNNSYWGKITRTCTSKEERSTR